MIADEIKTYSARQVAAGEQRTGMALLLARVGIAGLMLVHGIPKLLLLFSGEPVQFPEVMGLGSTMALTLAVLAEVFCSLMILAGLGTRLAVVPLIITMLVAVFSIHGDDPFAKQELGLHYLLVYLVLLIAGSGKYSVDYLMKKKSRKEDIVF